MSEAIAQQWLSNLAATANALDLDAHMNLISKKINLIGMPGYESINYEQWHAQCEHEFSNKILKSVAFSGFKMSRSSITNIMFKTYETVEANDGTINAQGIEVIIEKEDDGQWRAIQERVLLEDETARDQLLVRN